MSKAVARKLEETHWEAFLTEIADGVELPEAMKECRIAQADINAITRDPLQSERFQQARLESLRSTWSALDLEECYARIARGVVPAQAVLAVRGSEEAVAEFFQLVEGFQDLGAQFERAMRIRTLNAEAELLALADDKSGDVLETPKGPIPSSAAVGRSKLQTDVRLRLAAVWNPKRYGEKQAPQVNVQINNHAEQLEAARERAKTRGAVPQPKPTQTVIDVAISPIEKPTVAELRSHSDAKAAAEPDPWTVSTDAAARAEESSAEPKSTLWREED
jgi:hypothetical protein